jgi:predicted lipid-binding transport protein (Tim44 family)
MNFNAASIPVDLILFGMIALFLILRLRSVLGKRTGLEVPAAPVGRRPAPPTVEGRAEPAPTARPLPDPTSPVGQRLASLRTVERGFEPAAFLRGAEAAFRRIVEAFAAGDRTALRPLLTDGAYTAFEGAITAREAAGQTQRAEIKSIHQATIEQAELVDAPSGGGKRARIEVRFLSDQISLTLGPDGQPVTGADAVTELADRWIFERLYPGDATWRLGEAKAA